MDKWVLSKLQQPDRQVVDAGLTAYSITEPARAIADFVDELSNWYVRRWPRALLGQGHGRATS